MATINNPHDAFFKIVFAEKDFTKAFLRGFLPSDLINELDLDTLEISESSFIDDDLRQTFSDLIFR